MKTYQDLIYPVLALYVISYQSSSIKISADFDKGSIGDRIETGTNHLVYTDNTQPIFSYDQKNWKRNSAGIE